MAALRSFIATVLRRYRYFQLSKGPRGVLFVYTQRLTGYSRQHLSKLNAQYRDTQSLKPRKRSVAPVLLASTRLKTSHCWRRPMAYTIRPRAQQPRCRCAAPSSISAMRATLGSPSESPRSPALPRKLGSNITLHRAVNVNTITTCELLSTQPSATRHYLNAGWILMMLN